VVADEIISRLEKKLFPGLRASIDFIEVKLKPLTSFFLQIRTLLKAFFVLSFV